MTATIAAPSIFDKALPTLARATTFPETPAVVAYIGQWLAVLGADPDRGGEFDRELEAYATELRQAGYLVGDQASGFLLALWSRLNARDPLQAVLRAQVDRRKALQGWRWCPWRGYVPVHEFDRWKFDRARERAALPRKGER